MSDIVLIIILICLMKFIPMLVDYYIKYKRKKIRKNKLKKLWKQKKSNTNLEKEV